jgi:hypothetical protein
LFADFCAPDVARGYFDEFGKRAGKVRAKGMRKPLKSDEYIFD